MQSTSHTLQISPTSHTRPPQSAQTRPKRPLAPLPPHTPLHTLHLHTPVPLPSYAYWLYSTPARSPRHALTSGRHTNASHTHTPRPHAHAHSLGYLTTHTHALPTHRPHRCTCLDASYRNHPASTTSTPRHQALPGLDCSRNRGEKAPAPGARREESPETYHNCTRERPGDGLHGAGCGGGGGGPRRPSEGCAALRRTRPLATEGVSCRRGQKSLVGVQKRPGEERRREERRGEERRRVGWVCERRRCGRACRVVSYSSMRPSSKDPQKFQEAASPSDWLLWCGFWESSKRGTQGASSPASPHAFPCSSPLWRRVLAGAEVVCLPVSVCVCVCTRLS